MKKPALLFITLSVCFALSAQNIGGPDTYGYTWVNSNHTTNPPTYSWFDIDTIGIQVTGLGDDNIVGPFDISGGFTFYWYPVSKFWIGSNGFISFAGNNIASPFQDVIPVSGGANDWIAPLLSDLNFSGSGNPAKCYYYYNIDTICVSWVDVPFWTNATPPYTGSNSFQLILNKADSSITFNYKSTNMGTTTSIDDIIGIENVTGTIGLAALANTLPSALFTIKYYYPPVVTYAVTDVGVNWNDNPGTGAIFVKKNGQPVSLKANIKNYGNQNLGTITVLDTVKNSFNISITNGATSVSSLAVQHDTTLTFPNTFVAPLEGTYTFRTAVTGITGDMVASNNKKTQEVVAIDTSFPFMTLNYSDNIAEAGLAWNGGNGGIGIYIEPPLHPARIISSQFYIYSNATTPVGFYAMIYDDDGPNNGPGTLLDSVYVPPASVSTGLYTNVPVATNNLVIPDGGIYLLWYMAADGINIGRDLTPPISARTYEVITGTWASYRDMLSEDFLMGIIIQHASPMANFTADTTSDPQVIFTDTSDNYPAAWHWDFDDNGATSILQHPAHTYTSAGDYNVCLRVTNAAGIDSVCKIVTIANAPPLAAFSYDDSLVPAIAFTDLSGGTPNAWYWDFDDIGNDTSSQQNPVYTFQTTGLHSVCLTAWNSFGPGTPYCETINVLTIGITEPETKNRVNIYPNPSNGNTIIQFNNIMLSNNTIVRCYDITGSEVNLTYSASSGRIILESKVLNPGIYFLKIFNNNEKLATGKLVIK